MNQSSSRNNRSKFKTSGALPIIWKKSINIPQIHEEKPKRVTRWTWNRYDFDWLCPKISPGHCVQDWNLGLWAMWMKRGYSRFQSTEIIRIVSLHNNHVSKQTNNINIYFWNRASTAAYEARFFLFLKSTNRFQMVCYET